MKKKRGVIIETTIKARQAEPGPSIPLPLIISVIVAVIANGFVWFVFFRTVFGRFYDPSRGGIDAPDRIARARLIPCPP